jgi:hypothetical protein
MDESRKLGEQERLLNYLHAFGGLIAIQVLHVEGRIDPAQVRLALSWLQSQHPILRAHVRYGGPVFVSLPPYVYRQPYFDTAGTTEIPLHVVEDPDPEAWRKVMAKDLRTPIGRGRHPRVRVTLVRSSPDAELNHIVICADHATIDAQSGNMLGGQLLEFLGDPEATAAKAPVHETLPPPLESGLPKKPTSGKLGYQPAIRLPNRPIRKPKYETRVLSYHIGDNLTAKLKAAIKTNRTTLHGTVTAAFLSAIRDRYSLEAMTVLTTIDLRRLMKPPLHHDTYGCYIDILRTRNAIGPDFWATAREASFKLITTLAKDQEDASILKLFTYEVYRKEMVGMMTHHRRIDGLAVTTAGESSLRRDYGSYILDDVTMAVSLDMFGPSMFVIASERLGGIDLSVGYTAYAMSDEEVKGLSDRAIGLLEASPD